LSEPIIYREAIIAGGSHDFIEVHHVMLRGTNRAIGKKIAEIARDVGVRIHPDEDTMRNRAQREYIQKNYSILYERMRGAADAFGENLEDDRFDFSGIEQYPTPGIACSTVFYPGSVTESGHRILSRNFDFTTGTTQGTIPEEGEMALLERPYVFEMYPDSGHASLAVCGYDLLGGVFDGINASGLAVSVLGDEETMAKYGLHPSSGVGLHELLCMRYLLDNCGNTEEAKEALFSLKHYYGFLPCHYLVADADGNSFVFEFSSLRNSIHFIDGKGIQVVTNHLLHMHPSMDGFPAGDGMDVNSFRRFEKLYKLTSGKRRFGGEEIKKNLDAVANEGVPFDQPGYALNRTLWQSQYDIDERCLSVKFYLGEKEDKKGNKVIRYSDDTILRLKAM
jgi:predicted choloylglycine hydrolase